jgi:ABC-type glucose/galactose transport system permease subunit
VTSPALVLAAFARGNRGLIATLWVAAVFVAVPSFLYYADGGAQWGMRHALDFVPFLFPLIVLGTFRVPRAVTYALCAVSILIGGWGLWYWRTFYDHFLVH